MLVVPLQPKPNQTVTVSLGGQICQINVYAKRGLVFLDLYVDNAVIIAGVICENLNRIVRSAYLDFLGDLAFFDNQGSADPAWPGLGSRWTLMYLETADLQGN